MRSRFPQRIGILGGGQLARLLSLSCYDLGLTPVIFSKSKSDPAAQVCAEWFEEKFLNKFLDSIDVVIIENEFIDLKILNKIAARKPLFPSPKVLQRVQSKLTQKIDILAHHLPTAPFYPVSSALDLETAFKFMGPSLVLKKSTHGYDGRGVVFFERIKSSNYKTFSHGFFEDNPHWLGQSAYAEARVEFKKEIAVVVARDIYGKIESFPPVITVQEKGICTRVWQPDTKELTNELGKNAQKLAVETMRALNGVGVFAVEMFLSKGKKLLINEIAPRVHNSGHITLDACNVSQFEQHLRAVLGFGLVKPEWLYKGSAMENIVGREIGSKKPAAGPLKFDSKILQSGKLKANIYWYGKTGFTSKRKLGHINVVGTSSKQAVNQAKKIRESIDI